MKFKKIPGWLRVEARKVYFDYLIAAQSSLSHYEEDAHKMTDAEKQEVLQQTERNLHQCRHTLVIYAALNLLPEFQLHYMDKQLGEVEEKHKKLLDKFLSTY